MLYSNLASWSDSHKLAYNLSPGLDDIRGLCRTPASGVTQEDLQIVMVRNAPSKAVGGFNLEQSVLLLFLHCFHAKIPVKNPTASVSF